MRFRCLLAASWLVAGAFAEADVVYPARLVLEETEPGQYDVAFTLPVLEGRKLRAEPLLPPICSDASEREVVASPTSFTMRWRVTCEPASLAGEAILIDGLLGTQTELRVEIGTRDGRRHTALLKPSRPGLIVPRPPKWTELVSESVFGGMRRILRVIELWMLVLVGVFPGSRASSGAFGIAGFAFGYAVAQWLAARNGLLVSAHIAPAFALVGALLAALDLTRFNASRVPLRPLWLAAALLGALFGGVRPDAGATEGLSSTEQVAASVFFALGIAFGLALIAGVAVELQRVSMFLDSSRWKGRIGYVVGVLAVALLVPRLVALSLLPTDLPRAPFELAILASLLAFSLWRDSSAAFVFAAPLGAGMLLGFTGADLPFGNLVVLGSLFLFGTLLALGKPVRSRFVVPLAVLAAFGHGWNTSRVLDENVSLPAATAAGAGLVGLCLFYAGVTLWSSHAIGARRPVWRALGVSVAVLALAWRIGEYVNWFDREVAAEAALGIVRVPLLALVLLGLAALLWPRRRVVLEQLGIARRASRVHWALLGLSFFLLPVGTLAARNPLFEPEAPRGDDARRIVSQVLWNTYHAFNLDDEDELYHRLSENVSGDLVEDLYLDSRRRLTAGTREGAEVTVRDVSVVEVEDAVQGTTTESGFVYDCRWVVTARVRHLQHVHHRQNIYNGKLAIRVDGDRWKIVNVELTSEDRVVLPWNPA